MIVKNLTNERIEMKLRTIIGHEEFSVDIQPYGQTDLEMVVITNKADLGDRISIDDEKKEVVHEEVAVVPEVVEEESHEDVHEATTLESTFICDECGAEFASERGLASHKTRAHKH